MRSLTGKKKKKKKKSQPVLCTLKEITERANTIL